MDSYTLSIRLERSIGRCIQILIPKLAVALFVERQHLDLYASHAQ